MKNPLGKHVSPRLHQVLGTKDEGKQVQIVNSLAQPTVIVTIALRPFDGHVQFHIMDINGHEVPAQVAYYMLDQARQIVTATERQAVLAPQQAPTSQAPAVSPGTDAPPNPESSPGAPILQSEIETNGKHHA